MEPSIQYAHASDGVSIAYWSIGQGLPLIHLPPIPWSNLKAEWEDRGNRSWLERSARNTRLVRYDNRGSGLSDRTAPSFEPEAFLLDIDAVMDALGIAQFAVSGVGPGARTAASYASSRPERVTHLVLWCPMTLSTPQWEAMRSLVDRDWDMFTETAAHAMVAGWAESGAAHRYAAQMRASVDNGGPVLTILDELLVPANELSGIECPTLVLQRSAAAVSMDSSRYLAANIPGAEFVLMEGEALLPWVGDMESIARAVDRFLGVESAEPVDAGRRAEPVAAGGMATILFTDIEGSTTMTQKVGDAAAQHVVRAHNTVVRAALSRYGGAETKHTGDGIMASFPLASSAIDAAIAIQQGAAAAPVAFRVRIGLNAGEPVVEEADLFGTAVQLARRVCDRAEAGTVLVTDVVRQLAAGKGFLFSDQGVEPLKGFDEPVRLYGVRWQEGQNG